MFRVPAIPLLFLTFALPLGAEVFLLAPGSRKGKTQGNFAVNGTKMMELPVKANGIALTLTVSKLDVPWSELQQKMGSDQAVIRIRRTLSDGRVQRQLFAASGSKTNPAVTLFEVTTPAKLPAAEWPKELPRPTGDVQPGLVLDMGKMHGVYVGFSTAQSVPENQLASLSARLRTQGWQPAGAEGSAAIRGRGELFIRTAPQRELLWVNFSPNGGALFYRPQRMN